MIQGGRKPLFVMPLFSMNSERADVEDAEYAFLDRSIHRVRHCNSSLSKPGRICSNIYCRSFIPGGVDECHQCRSAIGDPGSALSRGNGLPRASNKRKERISISMELKR